MYTYFSLQSANSTLAATLGMILNFTLHPENNSFMTDCC